MRLTCSFYELRVVPSQCKHSTAVIASDIGKTGFHVCNRKIYVTTIMYDQTNLRLVAELLAIQ